MLRCILRAVDLRAFREQAAVDLTQKEVADASGVPQPTISRIESGRIKRPRFDVVDKLQSWADELARTKRLPTRNRLELRDSLRSSAA